MAPTNPSNPSDPAIAPDHHTQWLGLCDDFVNLEGQCALLCELLTSLSRRDIPLDAAGKHGIDRFSHQFREQLAAFKQQLYNRRSG